MFPSLFLPNEHSDKLICLLVLNLKISITKVTGVSFELQKIVRCKISKLCHYRSDLESPNSATNDWINFHLCSCLKLLPPIILQFTKIKLLKGYEK